MHWEDLMMDVFFVTVGLALLIGGFAFRVYVYRRRFYRRGPGGLQHFPSYRKAVLIRMYEGFLMFVSIPMMILGIVIVFLWSLIVIDRGQYEIEDTDKIETTHTEPSAHFLVPAEKDFGTKKICPVPANHSLSSISTLGQGRLYHRQDA